VDVWALLSNPDHRAILGWLGGGLVVLAGGAWTVIKFFAGREPPAKPEAAPPPPGQRVTSRDGIAAGGNVSVSTRHGLTGWQPVLLVLVAVGAVLLAASFAGNRVTATDGSAAVGGDVGGDVTVGAPPAPASQ
jgi:hypothetical protein